MNPTTEAFEFGKRIGHQYHGIKPMATVTEAIEHLSASLKYRQKVKPMLREIAGYENTRQIYPTENTGYQSDMFRKHTDDEKELLASRVEPAFWHGFEYGFRV